MHLCGYIGLPAVREAMSIAKGVFAEKRAEPEGGMQGA
jgi:alkylhydroperoxidase/carboxymuconolactone decarboxylase family protein YurZ